jgi:hypothetical protein
MVGGRMAEFLNLTADLPTVQTSSKIMFRRGLKTVKTGTQMCEI